MLLCSTNPGKIRAFGGLLAALDIPLDPVMHHEIPETGDTFEANALEKAQAYAALYPGKWLLAEDSGLVVPALGGWPGPWSAMFDDTNVRTHVVTPSRRSRAEIEPYWHHPGERPARCSLCLWCPRRHPLLW